VEVEDTGIGIRAEDLPKLFREFQQLDAGTTKALQGTGLGPALTRRIAEAQGGTSPCAPPPAWAASSSPCCPG